MAGFLWKVYPPEKLKRWSGKIKISPQFLARPQIFPTKCDPGKSPQNAAKALRRLQVAVDIRGGSCQEYLHDKQSDSYGPQAHAAHRESTGNLHRTHPRDAPGCRAMRLVRIVVTTIYMPVVPPGHERVAPERGPAQGGQGEMGKMKHFESPQRSDARAGRELA